MPEDSTRFYEYNHSRQDRDKGRYFLIDGHSWENACHRLGESVAPSFIAWEESKFFDFLKSRFMVLDKPKASKKLAGKAHY